MAVIFWRGFGPVLIPLVAVCELLAMAIAALLGANVSESGQSYNGYGLLIAGVVVSAFNKFYLQPKRVSQLAAANQPHDFNALLKLDSLMFIPLVIWPGILLVGGFVLSIINLINH